MHPDESRKLIFKPEGIRLEYKYTLLHSQIKLPILLLLLLAFMYGLKKNISSSLEGLKVANYLNY